MASDGTHSPRSGVELAVRGGSAALTPAGGSCAFTEGAATIRLSMDPDVPELGRKMQFLHTKSSLARQVAGLIDCRGLAPLSRLIDVKHTTIRDQIAKGWLRSDIEIKVARRFQFHQREPAWAAWLESDAKTFQAEYEALHKSAKSEAPQGRDTSARLKRGPRHNPIPSPIKGMASVQIDGRQFGAGSANLEIVVSCGMPMVAGANITIKRAIIELICGEARLKPDTYREWIARPKRVVHRDESTVSIVFEAGYQWQPIWRLLAEGSSIGTLELDPDLIAVEDLASGDQITVELGTWLMDIQDDETIGPAEDLADGICIADSQGGEIPFSERLSTLKRRVISCIRKRHIPSMDGYVPIASHKLEVCKEE